MSLGSSRKPRCVGAMATYLNAGLWGSRFVGDCEVSTNGEMIWVKGHRVPVWMAWARVASYVAFLPVGFFSGVLLGETLLGHRGYPPLLLSRVCALDVPLGRSGNVGFGHLERKPGFV
jgi:hypothetical protein